MNCLSVIESTVINFGVNEEMLRVLPRKLIVLLRRRNVSSASR
jgi:hypothetical protein